MQYRDFIKCLEANPVIASISDDLWNKAIDSPAQVIFYLSANILTIEKRVTAAHEAGKILLVHADLAEGIGKDSSGIKYLQKCGVDGIISTKAHMIKLAKEYDMITIQRTFLFDTKGVESISDVVKSTAPHFLEIMPGVIGKEIIRFSKGPTPVIAGGLIEEKVEVTRALCCGAIAVSTGKQELWFAGDYLSI